MVKKKVFSPEEWTITSECAPVPTETVIGLIEGTLTDVELPHGISKVKYGLFYARNNESLKSVYVPESTDMISGNAFDRCVALETVTGMKGIKSIGTYAFRRCTSLKDVAIGNMCKSIAAYSFDGCTGLEQIYLPKSIKTITNNAFRGCSCDIYCGFSEGDVSGAPWGTSGTIHYDVEVE